MKVYRLCCLQGGPYSGRVFKVPLSAMFVCVETDWGSPDHVYSLGEDGRYYYCPKDKPAPAPQEIENEHPGATGGSPRAHETI